MIQGDKIAILALEYISKLVKIAGIDVKIGIVQTAYANGASTKYVESLGVPVVFTCTGVKHLHHAAKEFDIGVYFEANGHGTVIFSKKAQALFMKENDEASHYQIKALRELHLLSLMINPCVGDALSDLLLVILIISQGTTFEKWNSSYTDLPSLQTKVLVSDKNVFVPGEADMVLLEPLEIQECVDVACHGILDARCFVRPSGTEDCVRVYCEARSKEDVENISNTVCGLIRGIYKPCRSKTMIL